VEQRTLWYIFVIHCAIYSIVNFLLIVINFIGGIKHLWFISPLLVWGLILAGHYFLNRLIIDHFFQRLIDLAIQKLRPWL
jgi:hypothetical protein